MAKSKIPQRGLKNCILKHGSPYSVIIFDRELVMEFYLGKWVVSYVEDIGNMMGNAHIGGEPRGGGVPLSLSVWGVVVAEA